MSLYDIPVTTLGGEQSSLKQFAGKVVLAVNVASKCGFTPQYDGLQALHERLSDRPFTVIGFPCNQFLGQEPGSAEEIDEFCRVNFGVSFPLFEKIDVNGDEAHPIFTELKKAPDETGEAGDVRWNFEKFLITPDGTPLRRFRTQVTPDDSALLTAIEELLPGAKLGERDRKVTLTEKQPEHR